MTLSRTGLIVLLLVFIWLEVACIGDGDDVGITDAPVKKDEVAGTGAGAGTMFDPYPFE